MLFTAVVIDDSSVSRTILRRGLSSAGFEVLAEGTRGDQVLELYESHRPTVITIDIVLPGADGVTAARQLLSKYPDANVVMCSAINAREKIVACRDAGVTHFILKPFSVDKVVEVAKAVASRLGQPAAASGRR